MAINLTTLEEISNVIISILVMQILKKIGELSELAVWKIRIIFGVSQLLQFLLLYIVYRKLRCTNDERKVRISKHGGPISDNEDEYDEITYNEYDRNELKNLSIKLSIQLLISMFCHYKWGIIQPFIIQSIVPMKSFFIKPLFMAHIRGIEVLRPFDKNVLFQKLPSEVQKKKKKDD